MQQALQPLVQRIAAHSGYIMQLCQQFRMPVPDVPDRLLSRRIGAPADLYLLQFERGMPSRFTIAQIAERAPIAVRGWYDLSIVTCSVGIHTLASLSTRDLASHSDQVLSEWFCNSVYSLGLDDQHLKELVVLLLDIYYWLRARHEGLLRHREHLERQYRQSRRYRKVAQIPELVQHLVLEQALR